MDTGSKTQLGNDVRSEIALHLSNYYEAINELSDKDAKALKRIVHLIVSRRARALGALCERVAR